jgi:hypothetical protein
MDKFLPVVSWMFVYLPDGIVQAVLTVAWNSQAHRHLLAR